MMVEFEVDVRKKFLSYHACAGFYCSECNGLHNREELELKHPDVAKQRVKECEDYLKSGGGAGR